MKNTEIKQPIIIIGMHRSGTTMLSKMLQQMGLFIGWNLNDEHEAKYFLNRNEMILKGCGGSWDNPVLIDNMISRTGLRERVASTLFNDLGSIYTSNFLGPKLYLKYRSILDLNIPWGWKDPRNTFLLPLWLDIFPEAKVIHIYRNGLDIAQSLAVREQKRIEEVLSEKPNLKELALDQKTQFDKESLLLFIIKKFQYRWSKLSSLYKYGKLRIQPCISIQSGFDLWSTYIDRAFEHLNSIRNTSLNIKYEDFLLRPKTYLMQLNEFCALSADEQQIENIANTVNVNRRYSFKNDTKLMEFYETVKKNQWMEKLNYHLDSEKTTME